MRGGTLQAVFAWRRGHRKLFWFLFVPVVLLILLVVVGSYIVDHPLRGYMERNLNQHLKGYTAHVPRVSFHPLGFSISLFDVSLAQNAHPSPPIAQIHRLKAGVHWRALLHGALVADFLFDRPKLHVDLTQFKTEAHSKVKLKDRGWQEALESIYPLKINQFRIRNGNITYVDQDPHRPLRLSDIYLVATNIRNVRAPEHVYPSDLHLTATVFENGKLRLDGHANFLQEPFAGFDTDIELKHVELDRVEPVAEHANLHVNGGLLDGSGHVEYAPNTENFHLKTATLRGADIEYAHQTQTQQAEQQRASTVKNTAQDLSNKPNTLILVDRLKVEKCTIGYIDKTKQPGYRVFLSDIDAEIKNFSNHDDQGATGITLTGKFMDSGATTLNATFWPEQKSANMDMALQITGTDMTTMQNLFQTYGDFEIAKGRFSFFSELALKQGSITGYVKPLFEDMSVTDNRTEKDRSVFHKAYVALVGAVTGLLQNPHRTIATETEVKGSTENPKTSLWQTIGNLIQNAFFKSILPEFDKSIGKTS